MHQFLRQFKANETRQLNIKETAKLNERTYWTNSEKMFVIVFNVITNSQYFTIKIYR